MATPKPTGTAKETLAETETSAKSGTVSKLREDAADVQEKATQAARETYDAARETVSTQMGDAQARMELAGGEIERNVRENPALALGAAVGVGFLLGLAVRGMR